MKLREKKKISFKEQLDHTESSGSEDEYKEESGVEEESDSMSEIEDEEEEDPEEEIEMEVEEKKPKPKKKPVQKRKSPIIKKENKNSTKPKSNILMESDSEDNDNVDKSEKEILELQKVHFLNNGTELLNSNEFFRKRKSQLQNYNECTEFEFNYESDHSDTSMTVVNNTDTTTINSSNSDSNSNQPSIDYEEVTRNLAEIIIKTLELGFMIPITKSIQKGYSTYLQNEIKNNPNMKNDSYSQLILNSPTVNDDVVTHTHTLRQVQPDKSHNKTNSNPSQYTTTTTTSNDKDSNDNNNDNNKNNETLNEAVTSPVPQIPQKRKRGRPPKNKNANAATASSSTKSSTETPSPDSKKQKKENKGDSKITSYFNQVPSEASTPTTVPSTPTTPKTTTSRVKRRKLKSNSVPDGQTMSIQSFFKEQFQDTTLKDVKMEPNSEQNSTSPYNNPNIIKLFKCNVSGSNFKCFFPTCSETFSTSEDLVKHIASCFHDISPFIERRYIEKYLLTSSDEAMKLYKKLPLTDFFFESPKKYNFMVANRKLDISFFGELPLKINFKRKEELPSLKKFNITKNEKAKIYTPFPNKSYQINIKKNVFEWETMAYETIRPSVTDFERVSEKTIKEYTNYAGQISVKFKHKKSKKESDEIVKPFESTLCKNTDHLGYIFNTGGSVWGLDWCPIIGKETQYLAVGGFKGTTDKHYVIGEKKSEKGCIQIWNVGKISDQNNDDVQPPFLDLVLLHDYGYVCDLKWCPYGGYEKETLFETKKKDKDPSIGKDTLPRLGILAASFGDGSTKIFIIPHPHTLKEHFKVEKNEPIYVKLAPTLQFSHPDTSLWRLTWGHSKLLAVACTNGCVAVYNIQNLLSSKLKKDEVSEPYLFFPAHDACIQKIEFYDEMKAIRQHYWGKIIESENDIGEPSLLVSCSNDGKLCVYDIRDPYTNSTLVRLRAFFITASWVPHLDSIILGTIDNDVRMLNLKESCELEKTDQKHDEGVNKPITTKALTVHNGSLWDMECSKYNSYIISGGVDGKLKLANSYYWFKKKMKVSQAEIYQMEWDTKTNQLTFIEGYVNEEINIVKYKNSNSLINFFPPEVAIQKTKWNLNKESTLWIASGFSNGLVRYELL